MRIVHVSDTHNMHRMLKELPKADIIVHSGDFTMTGTKNEAVDFINWFCDLPYRHKIFIAGNHDFCMFNATVEGLPENVYMLNRSDVTIDGVRFFGIPYFVESEISGEDEEYIKAVPNDCDILITHMPPFNILDFSDGIHYGNMSLRKKIAEVKPLYHLFGHIHNNYGVTRQNGTVFSNAALLNDTYEINNKPRVFEINIK